MLLTCFYKIWNYVEFQLKENFRLTMGFMGEDTFFQYILFCPTVFYQNHGLLAEKYQDQIINNQTSKNKQVGLWYHATVKYKPCR